MKIRLSVIPPDDLTDITRLVDDLRNAVNVGDMDGVDSATDKLLAMTANTRSVNLSEEEWRRFLAGAKIQNAAFQSNYLISEEQCSQYFPDTTAETMILQLPFSEWEGDDV